MGAITGWCPSFQEGGLYLCHPLSNVLLGSQVFLSSELMGAITLDDVIVFKKDFHLSPTVLSPEQCVAGS